MACDASIRQMGLAVYVLIKMDHAITYLMTLIKICISEKKHLQTYIDPVLVHR